MAVGFSEMRGLHSLFFSVTDKALPFPLGDFTVEVFLAKNLFLRDWICEKGFYTIC